MTDYKITLYYNNCRERANNTRYPYEAEIHTAEDLASLVVFDHVSAEYTEYHRKNDNFIKANCIMLDVDNTHSDSENEWITPKNIRETFPDVPFYVSYSRYHMREKGGKSPRPKFHLYFPDKEFTNGEEYAKLKERVCAYFPYFDAKAKDIAHFFYGVETPRVEYYDGETLLSEFMETVDTSTTDDKPSPFTKATEYDRIPVGERNNTLHQIALKLLARFGDTSDMAYELFKQNVYRCEEPLPENEITTIWNGALSYYRKVIKTSASYTSPDQYNSTEDLEPSDYSDVGQAYVFVREYGDVVKYSPATNYLYYTGKVWTESELKVHRLVQQFTDLQIKEASVKLQRAQKAEMDSVLNKDDMEAKKNKQEVNRAMKYMKIALGKRDTMKIRAVLTEAKPMAEIDSSMLDADLFLLNTLDGTVDLRTKEIHPHTSLDYCTKITNVGVSVEGAELFANFLKTITCDNKELENYLQLVAGMFAVGAVYRENLVIAYGSGRNGKSTFFNLLARVLGDYSGNLSAETLTVNSRKNKSPEYAELRGKRLVIAAELQEGMRLDTAVVKKLCSTDPIYAEKKYRDPFSFIPSHTVVLYTNHLPDVGSSDDGTWRRLVVIPFNAVIEKNNDIKNYAEYLFNEAGGAVLSWIIEGAYKFIKAGYEIEAPEIVRQAIKDYREANDWVNNYLTECCETGKGFTERAGRLYENYRDYCKRNGEFTRKSDIFKTALEKAGFVHGRNGKIRYWTGLKIASHTETFDMPYVNSADMLPDYVLPSPPVTASDGSDTNSYEDENVEF